MVTVATTPRPRIVPNAYVLLSNWRYIEYSILRIVAGWGRNAGDWEDKLAVCYHTWLQAQIVDRMRKRLDMFPGGRPDGAVNSVFERICNAVLMAPTWPDAMAGMHDVLNPRNRHAEAFTRELARNGYQQNQERRVRCLIAILGEPHEARRLVFLVWRHRRENPAHRVLRTH